MNTTFLWIRFWISMFYKREKVAKLVLIFEPCEWGVTFHLFFICPPSFSIYLDITLEMLYFYSSRFCFSPLFLLDILSSVIEYFFLKIKLYIWQKQPFGKRVLSRHRNQTLIFGRYWWQEIEWVAEPDRK